MSIYPRFTGLALASAPEIMNLNAGVQKLMAGFEAFYIQGNTQLQGTGYRFYLIDPTGNPTIRLPVNPAEPVASEIKHLLVLNTTSVPGIARIDPGAELINSVQGSQIILAPSRRVEMLYLGGSVGWVTDAVSVNAAIGKTVFAIQARQNNVFGGNPDAFQIGNLSRLTDGNHGTATDEAETLGSLSAVSFYVDFGSSLSFSAFNLIGSVRDYMGDVGSPLQVILWTSNDLNTFNDFPYQIIPQNQNEIPFNVSWNGSIPEGRYWGATIWHVDRFSIRFKLQELEIY